MITGVESDIASHRAYFDSFFFRYRAHFFDRYFLEKQFVQGNQKY